MSAANRRRSLTRTVAGNTFWYALDVSVAVLSAFLTSIPLARTLGPEKLGYFTFLQWLTNMSSQFAMLGLPVTTRKYVADALGAGQPGIAWKTFTYSMQLQVGLSLFLLAAGSAAMIRFTDPAYLSIGLILLIATFPKMLACILSGVNLAAEDLRANTVGAVASNLVSVVSINLSLFLGWGLLGVAASTLISAILELIIKSVTTLRTLRPVRGATLPPEMRKQMLRFSGQSTVFLLLNLIVWDRSDFVFLKWLSRDIRQVSFFGLAFNLVDKLLMLPRSFSSAMAVSVMAEYGRDRGKFYSVASIAGKYTFLVSVPLMLGVAAVSDPLIRILYGDQYLPVIPVLAIAAFFGAVKPLLSPVQSLLQAEDRQSVLIWWGILAALVNIGLDILLIPAGGAQGAMIANGVAQVLAVVAFWIAASRRSPVRIPKLLNICFAGAVMAASIWISRLLPVPAVVQLALGILVGSVMYLWMVRSTGILDEPDVKRLSLLTARLPDPVRKWGTHLIAFFGPPLRPADSSL